MSYTKKDALMTRGMAVLCMVILHLFFRERSVVLGTPLLWFNQDIPVVYWFGYYSEVCISVYSICAGYAHYMLYKNGKASVVSTLSRILKLMVNYWIILSMFSIAGLIYSAQSNIPGSLTAFLKSIVLLHSYNEAWWYLNSYIIFLLIPPFIKYFPVEKLRGNKGLLFCLIAEGFFYILRKTGFWSIIAPEYALLAFLTRELQNLSRILPSAWLGALIYKDDILNRIHDSYSGRLKSKNTEKCIIGIIWLTQFIVMNLIHKSVFNIVFGFLTFILFNLWDKSEITQKVFLFLGKHSTNIWLSHVFFYITLFTGLVAIAKYPVFILAFTLVLCIITSYAEMAIESVLYRLLRKRSS